MRDNIIKLLAFSGSFLIFLGIFLEKKDSLIEVFNNTFFSERINVQLEQKNDYYRDYDFLFVQNTDSFSPTNYQDILNIYYTFLNSGQSTFTFYCPKEYSTCLSDVKGLANNQDILSNINNYVHPYNSFSHIETEYDSLGRITIMTSKNYSEEEIQEINAKIDSLYWKLVDENSSEKENIQAIHDYIINHSRYDTERSKNDIVQYKSDIAYGPLFEGYAICGGYTDLMQLFLEKMNVKSYRVSSNRHIWNAVFLDNTWYHLDLTWDDPVADDGNDYLEHNYFLISTKELLEMEVTQHNFPFEYYQELKEA